MIRDAHERARRTGLIAMSTATHIFVFTGLGLMPSPSEVLARHEMEFEVVEPPKPAPPPPPTPDLPPEPEKPEPARPRQAKAAEPEPVPEPEPETATSDESTEEPVADFTGETLVAEGGPGGWSTRVGTGAPMKGPVGKIGDAPAPTNSPAPMGPRVVGIDELDRRPGMPAGMDALLEKHYPQRARLQGVEGSVLLRVRILPDGRLGTMTVVRETPEGWEFAEACRKTLQAGGRWERPVGRGGAAVATDVKYTCRFEVD